MELWFGSALSRQREGALLICSLSPLPLHSPLADNPPQDCCLRCLPLPSCLRHLDYMACCAQAVLDLARQFTASRARAYMRLRHGGCPDALCLHSLEFRRPLRPSPLAYQISIGTPTATYLARHACRWACRWIRQPSIELQSIGRL